MFKVNIKTPGEHALRVLCNVKFKRTNESCSHRCSINIPHFSWKINISMMKGIFFSKLQITENHRKIDVLREQGSCLWLATKWTSWR